MKSLQDQLRLQKKLRVIGFDDAPFEHKRGSKVHVAGMVCSDTRLEGMLWCEVTKDGDNATDVIAEAVKSSKFYHQLQAVLIDGIAVGGFNIIDLSALHKRLNLPCIAVMRKMPDLTAIKAALANFDDAEHRWKTLQMAGEIHQLASSSGHSLWTFQVQGCLPELAVRVLDQLTDTGHVPEALRLAHIIGAAIKTGQSSNSA